MRERTDWTFFERLLSFITRVRPGEGHAAFLFFLHAFLLMASYQMVKALREAFMLARFSAETRSYAVAMISVLLMLVVPLYARLRRHADGAQLLRVVTVFFVVTLPLFALLAHYGVPITFTFYIWVSVYGVMVVAQLWAFAADSFNIRSGQRLFVVIMLGANLGALAGAQLTHLTVNGLSPLGLMLLATAALGATLFLAQPERVAIPDGSRGLSAERQPRAAPPKLLGGIGLVLRDPYLLMMALFVILLNWINSTGEFILADFVKAHAAGMPDPSLFIASFYGDFQFWVTLISLAIQLLLVSRIYRTLGMRGALLIQPVIVAVGYGVLAFAPIIGGFIPVFSLVRRIKFAENGVDYSLMNTTRQALFLPVDRNAKYDGKMAIDTFFWRFGDLIQAGGIYLGLNVLHWQLQQFALLNLLLALGWIALSLAMARGYRRKTLESLTNTAPEAFEPIPDLHCAPGRSFRHRVPPNAFRDADPGDVLVLRACCDNGRPLPRWLHFNVARQTFTGTLPAGAPGELRVTVIASDMDGLKASSTFLIRPSPA